MTKDDGGGTITSYIYDGDQIIAEYDGSGTLTAKYVYGSGIDEPIRLEKGGQSYYYHFDGLGSVTSLTSSTGQTSETYTYDAFGKPSTTSSIGNRFMFTGREYDAETGLYYYRARYYSPGLGRFLQRDPWGYMYGPNLYSYVRNNPINYLDPWGAKPGDKYPTQDDAAKDALNDINEPTKRETREHGGWIYKNKDSTYSYTPPQKGTPTSVDPGPKPPGATSYYHSHPYVPGYDSENFSNEK